MPRDAKASEPLGTRRTQDLFGSLGPAATAPLRFFGSLVTAANPTPGFEPRCRPALRALATALTPGFEPRCPPALFALATALTPGFEPRCPPALLALATALTPGFEPRCPRR